MNAKREKIDPVFKKASDEVWKKIKEETITFQDLAHLLDLCDDRAKLNRYGKCFNFYDCLVCSNGLLVPEEYARIRGLYVEKDRLFMGDIEKQLDDHLRDPEKKRTLFEDIEHVLVAKQTRQ